MTFSVFFLFDRVLDQHIDDSSDLLTSDKITIIPAFMWLQPPCSLCCGLVPLLSGKNIFLVIYLFPREEAWLHKNLYYNSVRYSRAFENIHVCLTVYTCSTSFVTFIFFFYCRLFWKRETIPCAPYEPINIIITNSEYTVMIEQKVSIGL